MDETIFDLKATYTPKLPRALEGRSLRECRNLVAGSFEVIFKSPAPAKQPSRIRREIDTFSNSLQRTLYNFRKMDPEVRKQLEVLVHAAVGEQRSLEEDLERLKQLGERLPSLTAIYHEMNPSGSSRGGPTTDLRFRRIAVLLFDIWKKYSGKDARVWRGRERKPGGEIWEFAFHACQHFLPTTKIPRETLFEALNQLRQDNKN